MSVQLDWEIDSEQRKVREQSGEDPESKGRRRRRQLRLLLLPLILVVIVAAVAGYLLLRLREVDGQIEQSLRATVSAEVTALRLGDQRAYLELQRSATDDWLNRQLDQFNVYQAMKLDQSVILDGQVLGVTVEGMRARVQLREMIDGAPYVRTWFYWRYEDLGWRHVPPDYLFWGESADLGNERLQVRYFAVDAPLAEEMFAALNDWLNFACASLGCNGLPPIRLEVIPDPGLSPGWSAEDDWLLRLRSPYVELARQDMPFDFAMRFDVANLLAERLVAVASQNLPPSYPADAFYLRSTIVSWLVGRFANIDTNTFMISSFASGYGDTAVGQVLALMQPESTTGLLYGAAPGLDAAQIDWRDFFTWRLALENELITRRDEGHYLALYDTREESVRLAAYQRFANGEVIENRVVVGTEAGLLGDGSLQISALVQRGDGGQETVLFRLVNQSWLRAN